MRKWESRQKLSNQEKEHFNAIFKRLKLMRKIHDVQTIKILNKDSVQPSLTLVLASVIEKCFEGHRLRSPVFMS